MVTQKAISAKIDQNLLRRLDDALRDSSKWGANRNNAINKALEMYLELLRIEEDPEGMTSEAAAKFAERCHMIYRRWR